MLTIQIGVPILNDMNSPITHRFRTALTAFVLGISTIMSASPALVQAATVPAAPQNLRAFTGGKDVALLWTKSPETVQYYTVYRNNKAVAQVRPAASNGYLTADGTRYYDASVSGGVTYKYQVSVTNVAGVSSPLTPVLSVTHPKSSFAVPTITVNTTGASDLAGVMNSAKATLTTWYPKIANTLAWPSYSPPSRITLKVDPAYTGVAYASGSVITVGAAYLRAHPNDMGLFVHEATHVIQQYGSYQPNFIVEGMADWTREQMFNDRNPAAPNAFALYNDGYGTSAYFLQWIASTYAAPGLVRSLNVAAHANTAYAPVIASATGGKTVGQLWTQFSGRPTSSLGPLKGAASKCLDVSFADTTNGTTIQLLDCVRNGAQDWLSTAETTSAVPGAVSLRVLGKCLDVQYSGTTAGTPVWLWDCNGSAAQQWVTQPSGALQNVSSGLCLRPKNGATANYTPLEIAPCDGSPAQTWVLPPA